MQQKVGLFWGSAFIVAVAVVFVGLFLFATTPVKMFEARSCAASISVPRYGVNVFPPGDMCYVDGYPPPPWWHKPGDTPPPIDPNAP
jgi:hypothetical protein